MAEIGRARLRIDSSCDQEAGEGMTTLVEADRVKAGAPPSSQRTLAHGRRRERLRFVRAEDEALFSPGDEFVLDKEVAQRGNDRDARRPARLFGSPAAR